MQKCMMTKLRREFLDDPIASNFTLGPETEAYHACTSIFNGETLIFGGKREYNQVI